MPVGACDELDVALVKKYASMRVDCPIASSAIDPTKMYDAMNDYASMQRMMFNINGKIKRACEKSTAMAIQYVKTKPLSGRAEVW
ncbi:hypothetical protein IKA92_06905 [bacterium]|nr:hypothetical protein [bacterium]